MRILAISDEPSQKLWGSRCREALEGVDLILSAGDLPPSYLSFLTCFTSAPVIYVHGNHDDIYEKKPPEGCLCADGKILLIGGVRILGLGGSFRYRPDCVNMYTEPEMQSRILNLRRKLRATGGFAILLTHAPIRGVGDEDHPSHRGFECFGPLLDRYRPAVMVHGHMHQAYTAFFQRERTYNGVPVINASTEYAFDLPETPNRREPTPRGIRIMEKMSRFE
jgi:predicted phosphodiesterase